VKKIKNQKKAIIKVNGEDYVKVSSIRQVEIIGEETVINLKSGRTYVRFGDGKSYCEEIDGQEYKIHVATKIKYVGNRS
tara:strand:+ start:331 stop:567 length:237 start_codon:yes stop_codon:yes gene_type:complete